jgi:hypothetical protein
LMEYNSTLCVGSSRCERGEKVMSLCPTVVDGGVLFDVGSK